MDFKPQLELNVGLLTAPTLKDFRDNMRNDDG